jgi:uncharacterized protein (DUF433 family)
MSTAGRLVATLEQARNNVLRYWEEMPKSPSLQDFMSYARGWYACRNEAGTWALAPSKFVGYADNDPDIYRRSHEQRDGRLTERLLRQWFANIPPGTPIYEELMNALAEMFARSGKAPNKRVHLHVLQSDLTVSMPTENRETQESKHELLKRVTFDPAVLGGRPAIRGLRISVSDVLELLAAGVSREEILTDFPYLEEDDISAALEYAARAVDHRVIMPA